MSFRHYRYLIKTQTSGQIIRSAAALFKRKLRDAVQSTSARLRGTEMNDEDFLQNAWKRNISFKDAGGLRTYFQKRKTPAFFAGLSGDYKTASVIREQYEGVLAVTIERADKICNHVFDILGSGDTDLGDRIDWHCDFKTGYCWNSRTYYRHIKVPYGKADIKVPWELSRFQHLGALGMSYLIKGGGKYEEQFTSQVTEWINTNKPEYGVNWSCTMDVAIRACNWISVYCFFRNSTALNDDFMVRFVKSLYQHGKHIMSNLEYGGTVTSNHYLSNIAGLIYIGTMFPEFRESGDWKAFAVRELVSEMEKQVYPDGCDFEASTRYHCLVLEIFFFSTLIVIINDGEYNGDNYRMISEKIFGSAYTEKLYLMFAAVLYLLKPNGLMPQIGDNDSGRFFRFEPLGNEAADVSHLPAFGALFFNEPDFKVYDSDNIAASVLTVFGVDGLQRFREMKNRKIRELKSRVFPDAGWFVMRNVDDYMLVTCGPNGQNGYGGHAHNDKLSFELCLGGKDVFVDAGTYNYTADPDMRNLFRSTEYHNTVSSAGLEQNRWPDDNSGLFSLYNDSNPKVLSWETADDRDRFVGEHSGYKRNGLVHRREIEFQKRAGKIIIEDRLKGNVSSSTMALFHLAPGLRAVLQGEDELMIEGVRMKFQNSTDIEISDYFYSSEYGVKESAQVIRVFFSNNLTTEIEKINE